jgi:hypothetical protein
MKRGTHQDSFQDRGMGWLEAGKLTAQFISELEEYLEEP